MHGVLQIFGIRGQTEKESAIRHKTPPEFMMELYKTITDPSGVTRGRNPYNAKVVRSFIERGAKNFNSFFSFRALPLDVFQCYCSLLLKRACKSESGHCFLINFTYAKSIFLLSISLFHQFYGESELHNFSFRMKEDFLYVVSILYNTLIRVENFSSV